MEDAADYVSDGLNGWENIQPPYSAATATEEDVGDVVVVRSTSFNDSTIFPPCNHEGLIIAPPPQNQQPQEPPQNQQPQEPPPATPASSSSSSSSPLPSPSPAEGEQERQLAVGRNEVRRRLRAHLGILRARIVQFFYRIRCFAVSRIGIWLFAAVTGVAGLAAALSLSLYARRLRLWKKRVEQEDKDRLMLLIRQKDQKINQLLIQIARMNEILSARGRIPVLRVVVSSSQAISA